MATEASSMAFGQVHQEGEMGERMIKKVTEVFFPSVQLYFSC